MTEAKRPLKVFLCHAHADRDAVKALYTRLTVDGVDAWLDKEKLLPGQDWEYEIRKAVREADVVVVCLSKQFNQAGFQQKEVRLVFDTAMEQPEGEIFIIPARLEECDVPERLQRYHWVDFFDDYGYEKLMQSIRLRDNQLGKARIEKEEAAKRRLPFFQTPYTRSNVVQQSVKNSNENMPLNEPAISDVAGQPADKKPKAKQRMKTEYIVAIIGAVATIIAGLLGSPLIEKWFSPVPVVTENPTLTLTLTSQSIVPSQTIETIQPSRIPTITITPTESFTPAIASLPTEITDAKGVSMMLVAAGKFTMGSENGNEDQKPVHTVYLDAFYMDQYEVTNTLYKACVNEGFCEPPHEVSSLTHPDYYGNPEFGNYPVIYVDWSQAKNYCEWRGAQLPTEAQWEKAARGVDERTYPWGEGIGCNRANYNYCVNDITEVGSYESGKSPYGIYDMAGNVWEWVSSLYGAYPYSLSDGREDLSLVGSRVIRGGAWDGDDLYARSSFRFRYSPTIVKWSHGFRCAKSANP